LTLYIFNTKPLCYFKNNLKKFHDFKFSLNCFLYIICIISAPINKTLYPNLFGYSVLAQSGITSGAITTINNGTYGNAGGTGQITGTYAGTATQNNDPANILLANTQLTALVGVINGLTNSGTPYNGGSASFSPGVKYTSTGTIVPSGTLTFNATSPDDQFFIVSGASLSITFIGAVTFVLNGGAQASNIFFLANNSGLISTDADGSTIQGNLIGGTQVTIAGARTINGSIFAQGTDVTFAANTTINGTNVCYLKGTKILTEIGYKLIEDLNVGDNVVSKGRIINNETLELSDYYSLEPVTWIGSFQAPNLNKDTLPICIKANALGENSPSSDLYVSPGHRILAHGKMDCARDLVNGTTIFQDFNHTSVHYYHFELNNHSSVIANGVLSESYLDFSTRNVFEHNQQVIETPLLEPITA